MARNNLDTAYTDDLYITHDINDPCYSIFPSLLLFSTPIVFFPAKDQKWTQFLCIWKLVREALIFILLFFLYRTAEIWTFWDSYNKRITWLGRGQKNHWSPAPGPAEPHSQESHHMP